MERKMGSSGTYYALLIAIDRYEYQDDLKAPVRDAEALKNILYREYGFAKEHITTLYNEKATLEGIRQMLEKYERIGSTDTLLISYAGHGKTDNYDQMNFWLPYDAEKSARARVKWIPNMTVIAAMGRSRARHVLLLNDSCYSGDFVGTSRDLKEKKEGYLEKALQFQSREVITSGMSEVVSDSGLLGSSPFMYHLLAGLRNHEKAYIDTDQMYEYVKSGVTGQRPLHRVVHEAGHQDGGLMVLYRQKVSVREKAPRTENHGRSEKSERIEGVTAAPNREEPTGMRVYKCPICGLRNREEETFECRVCGRDYLCRDHFDKELRCCEECAETKRKEAEQEAETKRKAEEKRKAEAKRKQEQEQREKAKQEEEQRQAARRKLETGLVPMNYVEGGSFQMGSDDGDAYSDEQPVRQVQVESFFIGTYPVTQEQYQKITGKNPSCFAAKRDSAGRPVEKVSWFDAVTFCNDLSRREGREEVYTIKGERVNCVWESNGYRLPTEAEWEYAARGGVKSRGYRYAGSNDPDEVAWYWNNVEKETRSVGEKRPNELGLHDMSGNVWEWCWDWYDDGYYKKSPTVNPTGPSSGSRRVLRGGSWGGNAQSVRSAYRYFDTPSYRSYDYGFRVFVPAEYNRLSM
jgi:formylglycine-generating enzyme